MLSTPLSCAGGPVEGPASTLASVGNPSIDVVVSGMSRSVHDTIRLPAVRTGEVGAVPMPTRQVPSSRP